MVPVTSIEWVKVRTTLPTLPYPASKARKPIRTERLIMRPMELEDLEALHTIRAQPEVMAMTARGEVDEDLDATMRFVTTQLPPQCDGAKFTFAICLAETGELIGHGGCHQRNGPLGWPEIGYLFRKEAWGQGYATEFLLGLLTAYWALPRTEIEIEVDQHTVKEDGQLTPECVVGISVEENRASQRVMTKAGFIMAKMFEEENLQQKGSMRDVYGYLAKRPDVTLPAA